MVTEKAACTAALADEDLGEVSGGMDWYQDKKNNKYYKWTGGSNTGEKYRCPNCGCLLHYGTGWRYYCDPCNESWFYESDLILNMGRHLWKECSWEEWYDYNGVSLH